MGQTKGRVTKTTVRAILADIYLWQGKYQECIDACDRALVDVVDNLDAIPSDERLGSELILYSNKESLYNTFYMLYGGNSYESIFELQFDYYVKNNEKVKSLYGTEPTVNPGVGFLAAAVSVFDNAKLWTPSAITEPKDVREKSSYVEVTAGDEAKPVQIFKYIGSRPMEATINGTAATAYSFYSSDTHAANWILYRLPDLYLMKAEALVERSGAPEDLDEALQLVNLIYLRSNPNVLTGFPAASFGTQDLMRALVLEERQREFMFEGKRWFDLLRFARREGNSETMLTKYLMRKFDANSQGVIKSKLLNMDALYMPIHNSELTRNTALVQNPYYLESEK
jgi:tetratricopeptide (TPR) repeat protein